MGGYEEKVNNLNLITPILIFPRKGGKKEKGGHVEAAKNYRDKNSVSDLGKTLTL
jgi:hypothetical protein